MMLALLFKQESASQVHAVRGFWQSCIRPLFLGAQEDMTGDRMAEEIIQLDYPARDFHTMYFGEILASPCQVATVS